MATEIKVGDTVRILPSYEKLGWNPGGNEIGANRAGVEFKVTDIARARSEDRFYVNGDPADRGIWAEYIELVTPTHPIDVPTEHGLYESNLYPVTDEHYSPLPYRLDATGFYLTVDSGANGIRIDEPYISKHGPYRLLKSEAVEEKPKLAHRTTRVRTRLNWDRVERLVDIMSGNAAITLMVKPNPSKCGDITGSTNLTPEQAEEISNDLLARVAEIRAAQ